MLDRFYILRAEGTLGNRNNCKQAKNNLLDGMSPGLCERRCLPRRKVPLSTSSINRLIPVPVLFVVSGNRSMPLLSSLSATPSPLFCSLHLSLHPLVLFWLNARSFWSEFAQLSTFSLNPLLINLFGVSGSNLKICQNQHLACWRPTGNEGTAHGTVQFHILVTQYFLNQMVVK